jgi:signal transduction histidine kinase
MALRLFPRSVGGLAMVVAGVSSVVTILVGVVTFGVVHHEIERQLDHRIELETNALLYIHRTEGFDALVRAVTLRQGGAREGVGYLAGVNNPERAMGYLVIDPAGRRRAGQLAGRVPPTGWSEFARFKRADGTSGVAQAMNSALPGGGRLVVLADRAALMQVDRVILRLFLLAFGLILLVGVVAAFGFGRVVQGRLSGIRGTAEAIIAGDLKRRVPLDLSGGEFDQLAQVLNRMLDRIGALMDNLKQVSSDIAHDLRTPLTRLRLGMEVLDEETTAAGRSRRVSAALRQIDEIEGLLSGLLTISEIESHAIRDRFAPIDLAEILLKLASAYEAALASAGMTLSLDLIPVTIQGDRRLLLRAFSNLVENSLDHAAGASLFNIRLRTFQQKVVLQFADNGPGVPVSERRRIFDRFVQLDPSRVQAGHGLGLNIVAAVMAAHNGRAIVAPSERGLTIQMEFPEAA